MPACCQARTQVAVLAEMAADGQAARRHHPGDLAAALVTLATAGSRAAALTAGGPAAIIRIQRLLAPPHRPPWPVQDHHLRRGRRPRSPSPATIACLPLIAVACDAAARPWLTPGRPDRPGRTEQSTTPGWLQTGCKGPGRG